jgi:small subunit ribosomal protein S6
MRQENYESAVVINATLEDSQIDAIIDKLKTTIQQHSGVLNNVENWGRKRLAYMIQKHKIGYYIFFKYQAPPSSITKIERIFKLDENIIRFLTLRLDKRALEYYEKHKVVDPEFQDEITIHDVPELHSADAEVVDGE